MSEHSHPHDEELYIVHYGASGRGPFYTQPRHSSPISTLRPAEGKQQCHGTTRHDTTRRDVPLPPLVIAHPLPHRRSLTLSLNVDSPLQPRDF